MKRIGFSLVLALALAGCSDVSAPIRSGSRAMRSAATTWSPIADMLYPRYRAAAVTGVDGRIYVFGGGTGFFNSSGAEVYSPATDSWSAIAPPGPLMYHVAARGGDGRIYFGGGVAAYVGGSYGQPDMWVYDPVSDSYASIAPMNVGRYLASAATGLDGKVYVVGGTSDFIPDFKGAEVYDPSTNTWTTLAPMMTRHSGGAAATGLDGKIYVFGNYAYPAPTTSVTDVYDPQSNVWTTKAGMPAVLSNIAAVASPDGRIYVFGGDNATTFERSAAVYAYETATDSWTTVASMSVGRSGVAGAGTVDGRIFAIGGGDGITGLPLSSAEVLQTTVAVIPPSAPTLAAMVAQLLGSSAISSQTASQLAVSVNAAAASIVRGNAQSARGQLGAFINKVESGMRSGKIAASDGAALIDYARAVLATLP
jgi:N-acetylneuraminic acid mutarotase